ncbi:mucin-associated surface protein (MASP), putative, partial [Trypanosoma cruzi]
SPGNPSDKSTQNEKETVGVAGQSDQSAKQKVTQAAAPTASESAEVPEKSVQEREPGGGASKKEEAAMDNTDQNAQEEKKKEEDVTKEEEEEGKGEENGANEEEERDTKKEEAVTGTAEGISTGGQEQPSLSSAAEGASNITNPNSTPTTGDDDPAADGAGTAEGKQNENKDANPKETSVTVAAMNTTTAKTGDSDSSTAVSHTSPLLLLLLVVACAAAAAVVAA